MEKPSPVQLYPEAFTEERISELRVALHSLIERYFYDAQEEFEKYREAVNKAQAEGVDPFLGVEDMLTMEVQHAMHVAKEWLKLFNG